jgi:acylphosphatase
MRIARRYLISGRVQGVGFRHFTYAQAIREQLSGWVRNLPDGRVEISAEGEREAVVRFELVIRQGPPGGRVDEVDVADAAAPGGPARGFAIR